MEHGKGVQLFNLEGIRTALGVTERNTTQTEVNKLFDQLVKKIDQDMEKGFTVFVGSGDDAATCAVYNSISDTARFVVTRMIIDGKQVSQSLGGVYLIPGKHEVSVTVDKPLESKIVNCSVFEDQRLVASRSNPFDMVASMSEGFVRDLVIGRGEDPSRLDAAIGADRSPYPFVLKMLQDFSRSQPDEEYIKGMFAKLGKRDSNRVVWNKTK